MSVVAAGAATWTYLLFPSHSRHGPRRSWIILLRKSISAFADTNTGDDARAAAPVNDAVQKSANCNLSSFFPLLAAAIDDAISSR